jgi:hypothetical protein
MRVSFILIKIVLNGDLNLAYQKLFNPDKISAKNAVKLGFNARDFIQKENRKKIKEQSRIINKSVSNKNVSTPTQLKHFHGHSHTNSYDNFSLTTEDNLAVKTTRFSLNSDNQNQLRKHSNGSSFSKKSSKFKVLNKELIKLESIYLKYKNGFNLKDSREFLLLIFKLKNLNK